MFQARKQKKLNLHNVHFKVASSKEVYILKDKDDGRCTVENLGETHAKVYEREQVIKFIEQKKWIIVSS